MKSNSQSLLSNNRWINDNEPTAARDYILTLNDMDYTIFTAKVDFTKPLGKGRVLETGLKGSWVKSDNNLDLSKAIAEEPFEQDPNSNKFIYEENVLAAYATYVINAGQFLWKLRMARLDAARDSAPMGRGVAA